jgi:very-short-patch-repair endonuclease
VALRILGVQAMSGTSALTNRVKLPKPLSKGEETFALHMKARGLQPVREHEFCPGRKWRFDFAFLNVPKLGGGSLAVEIEGGTRSGGRHSRHAGYSSDIEKYNTASLMGWTVLRFTTQMVLSGEAERQVAKVMGVA